MHIFESGYHKLKDPNDWDSVKKNGFNHSGPPEKQWLGAGIYFFLDPNGLMWATKWPHKAPRKDSQDGIVIAEIDISGALDFRDVNNFTVFRNILNKIRGTLAKKNKPYSDGGAIHLMFSLGLLSKPTCIIANFDSNIQKNDLLHMSKFVLKPNYCLPPYTETTQIQACVIDENILSNLYVFQPFSAL